MCPFPAARSIGAVGVGVGGRKEEMILFWKRILGSATVARAIPRVPETTFPARLKSSTGLALHFMRKGLPRRSWACPVALRGVLNGEGASATTQRGLAFSPRSPHGVAVGARVRVKTYIQHKKNAPYGGRGCLHRIPDTAKRAQTETFRSNTCIKYVIPRKIGTA